MGLRFVSDGFHQGQKDLGREAQAPTWLPTESLPFLPIDTGDNRAGNGGNGYFLGYMIDSPYAAFEPLNVAEAATNTTSVAHQTNLTYFDQTATQIVGIGGHGGDGNAAIGGSVSASGSVIVRCTKPLAQSCNETNSSWVSGGPLTDTPRHERGNREQRVRSRYGLHTPAFTVYRFAIRSKSLPIA